MGKSLGTEEVISTSGRKGQTLPYPLGLSVDTHVALVRFAGQGEEGANSTI